MPVMPTLQDFLQTTARRFDEAQLYFGHGTDNAWDEAVALVLGTLHLPYDLDPKQLDEPLPPADYERLCQQVERRVVERIPVPYLVHEAWFAGMPFYVDERVLIPRSPLAELIEQQFEPWVNADQVKRILDLCTGSGCIAIACAKFFDHAQIDASDISRDALEVAKCNIQKYQLEDRVCTHQADLFTGLPHAQYDVIVSNPPYITLNEMKDIPKEFQHEPALGLTAGDQGFDCIRCIIAEAPAYLAPEGILIVETGDSEHQLEEVFPHLPFTWLSFDRSEADVFLLRYEDLLQSA